MTAPREINSFRDKYRFLSNFYPVGVEIDAHMPPTTMLGAPTNRPLRAPSTEHLYQALKTTDPQQREAILNAPSPRHAKGMGRKLRLRPGWDTMRDQVMLAITRAKYAQNPELRARLLETGAAVLREGNTWGDIYWGVDLHVLQSKGRVVGSNRLGATLQRVRDEAALAEQLGPRLAAEPLNSQAWQDLHDALNASGVPAHLLTEQLPREVMVAHGHRDPVQVITEFLLAYDLTSAVAR